MHDLDDGRELEHLEPAPDAARAPDTAVVALVAVVVAVALLVGLERTSRPPPACARGPLSIRSWGVVGIDERRPVVFAVVDVPPGADARIVRLDVDGRQDTSVVIRGHAIVAVPVSTARLRGSIDGRLSKAAHAELGAVPVVARDADGWAVARAPLGADC